MKLVWALTLLGLALVEGTCPPATTSTTNAIVHRPPTSLPQDKQSVYIAGLFGLHSSDHNVCSNTIQDTSIQNLMAFMYGLDTAKDSVPDVNTEFGLGGIVFDTCKSDARTIQKVMNFETCLVGSGSPAVLPDHTFAYIGPETIWAHDVAPVIASFRKTQIAFSSTHPMFADKHQFPYLLRTVPDDRAHVHAIVSFLDKMDYKAVQFVYVDSGMGRSARSLFEEITGEHSICVEQYVHVPEDTSEMGEYKEAVDHLRDHPTVKAVVLWFDKSPDDQAKAQARAFMEAVKAQNAQGLFFWVATDAWGLGLDLHDHERMAEGAVLILPSSAETGFEAHYRQLKPDGQPQVFRDWWMNKFNCDLPESNSRPTQCDVAAQSLADEVINPRAGFIVKAVRVIAEGIKVASGRKCFNKAAICDEFLESQDHLFIIHDDIVEAMSGTMFNSTTGDVRVKEYDIYNYRRPSGNNAEQHYVKIGSVTQQDHAEPQITMGTQDVHVYDGRGVQYPQPASECPKGSCDKCAPPTDPPAPATTSAPVVTTQEPVTEKTGPYEMVRKKNWMIPLMVLAGLGIFITICFEIYILSKLIGTRTVKQFRTMWLGQLLLIGVFLSYLLLFAFVPSPTQFTCGLIRFGVGTCYAAMFSVLLVKLMIILSSESIGYLKGVYQVLMFIFAFAVQVVIDAEWLFLIPPTVHWNDDKMDWQCGDDYLGHIQSLVYVMFLILVCTIIAARTHGIITNHREGIFIGLAAGFSIPIWIAWTLVGSLNENTDFQEPTVAYGLLINTTLILFTMFLPKVRQLNTMGVEGIYLEDDGNENEAYGSVIYGPPSYQSRPGSVYQINGAPMITKDASGNPVQLVPNQQILYDQLLHPGYVRSTAGSVRSVPAYARNTKTLRVTGDLTGRPPFDKKAASEVGYKRPDSLYKGGPGTLKRTGSNTDLGAL